MVSVPEVDSVMGMASVPEVAVEPDSVVVTGIVAVFAVGFPQVMLVGVDHGEGIWLLPD